MLHPNIKELQIDILSDRYFTLKLATYKYQKKDGSWEVQHREAYDHGNGAAILLFNKERKTVILTRQFRLPTYINGNESGMMIEACAGLLDQDNPEKCIRRETEEETGYQVTDVTKIMEVYATPGSVTELLYLFIAEYSEDQKIHNGGGRSDEQEEIEVLEMSFSDALDLVKDGSIRDAKTILLLQYAAINDLMN